MAKQVLTIRIVQDYSGGPITAHLERRCDGVVTTRRRMHVANHDGFTYDGRDMEDVWFSVRRLVRDWVLRLSLF
jgi:hypothetical protein